MTVVGLAGGEPARVLVEIGAILVVLAVLARIASRFRFPPIPLYLLGGLVAGAVVSPAIGDQAVEVVNQIAVALLLFMLGLEYTGGDLVDSVRRGWRGGLVDGVANAIPGAAAGLILGYGWVGAAVLGGVTYVSSSGIIAKLLDDLDRLGNRETGGVLSVLVIEDLAMAFYLPLVAVLIAGGGPLRATASVLLAVALVGVAIVVASRHGRTLSKGIQHRSDEVVLLSVVGLLLVAGGLSEMVGVSAAVIAFLLGIAVSGAIAERTRLMLTPLRDLFAAAFFAFFGMQVDLSSLPSVLVAALALAVVTAATKVLSGWIATPGCSPVGRLRAGTVLIIRGEFSIVIAGLAVGAGVSERIGPLAVAYVLLTVAIGSVMTVSSARLGRLFGAGAAPNPRPPAIPGEPPGVVASPGASGVPGTSSAQRPHGRGPVG